MTRREAKYYAIALAVVIAAVVAGLVIMGDRADARTKRTGDGCISWAEWQTLDRGTMSEVERFAGVTGAGTVVIRNHHGAHVVKQYRWCGHPVSDGYFQISYDLNKRGQYMANYLTWFDYR